MTRIRKTSEATALGRVLDSMPNPLKEMLEQVDYVVNVDPVYMGLHDVENVADGRSYRDTSHCCWPEHILRPASERKVTVVLLSDDVLDKDIVLHEMGHAIDALLGTPSDDMEIVPLSDYAAQNNSEAFATAFQAWLTPEPTGQIYFPPWEDLAKNDPETLWFFENLSEGFPMVQI